MAKQTTITIETRSWVIVRAHTCHAWCPECGADAEMIALPDAAAISTSYAVTLASWLNSGNAHRCAGPEGATLVCLRSLMARLEKPTGGGPPSPHHDKERA